MILFKEAIKEYGERNSPTKGFSEDGVILAKASDTVRREIFSHKGFIFSGIFTRNCSESSLSMILSRVNIQNTDAQETVVKQSYLMLSNDQEQSPRLAKHGIL